MKKILFIFLVFYISVICCDPSITEHNVTINGFNCSVSEIIHPSCEPYTGKGYWCDFCAEYIDCEYDYHPDYELSHTSNRMPQTRKLVINMAQTFAEEVIREKRERAYDLERFINGLGVVYKKSKLSVWYKLIDYKWCGMYNKHHSGHDFDLSDIESHGSYLSCSRVTAIHPDCDPTKFAHKTNEKRCGFSEDKIICDLLNYETGQTERYIENAFYKIHNKPALM